METKIAPLRIEYFWNKNAGKGTEREGVGEDIARQLASSPFETLVHGTKTFEELDAAVQGIVRRRPHIVALSGGDGTLNVVLTRILNAYADALVPDLPMFLYAPTGTMRLVGASLGLNDVAPERLVANTLAMLVAGGRRPFGDGTLLRAEASALQVPIARSHILRVNDEYGFIWGAGIPVNFLNLYYEGDRLGHFGAGRVLFETFTDEIVSVMTLSESRKLLTRPVRGRITLPDDGFTDPITTTSHTAILASTVEQLGFGFRGMPHARSQPGKFMLRATDLSFFELGAMAPMLALGTALPGVSDAVIDQMVVQWEDPTRTTVDGEMREPHNQDIVACGPELMFLRP